VARRPRSAWQHLQQLVLCAEVSAVQAKNAESAGTRGPWSGSKIGGYCAWQIVNTTGYIDIEGRVCLRYILYEVIWKDGKADEAISEKLVSSLLVLLCKRWPVWSSEKLCVQMKQACCLCFESP